MLFPPVRVRAANENLGRGEKKKILGDEEEREENLCPRLEWERLDGSVVYDPGLRSPPHKILLQICAVSRHCDIQTHSVTVYEG